MLVWTRLRCSEYIYIDNGTGTCATIFTLDLLFELGTVILVFLIFVLLLLNFSCFVRSATYWQ